MSVPLPLKDAHRRAMASWSRKLKSGEFLNKGSEFGGLWIEDIPWLITDFTKIMKNDPTIKSITIEFGWCPVTDHHAFLKILDVKREEEKKDE